MSLSMSCARCSSGLDSPSGSEAITTIFTMDGIDEILNLQPRNAKGKPYQVKQVREVILQYNLRLEG
uniref:Uncharacterized protein n=1 Tax=Candidatus Kentrum sp. DK TaxID=2126562 RepID=A0A450TP79_9GAMM|nr:MAG: hypothetical protein BECKDK2373C_GA0170839_12274 [Candidatus Kentron sp. DK]